MNEYYNKLSIQFAEANRQGRERLIDELEIVLNLLKAAILSNQGLIKLSEKDIHMSKLYSLEIYKDLPNLTTELTLKIKD